MRNILDIQKCVYTKIFSIQYQKNILKKNDIKYLNVDASIINNNGCTELKKHLPINKNREGVKISVIVYDNGSSLNIEIG